MSKRFLHDITPALKLALVPSLVVAIVVGILWPILSRARSTPESTCLSNLRQIGEATRMYLQDNDEMFPAAWSGCVDSTKGWQFTPWPYLLEPYTKAGAVSGMQWAGSGGALWHCPDDHQGESMSYGTNAMISGAYSLLDCSKGDHGSIWQESKRLSDIHDPKNIVWAGDTNKVWDPTKNKYTTVMSDWMRSSDGPLIHKDQAAVEVWYQTFLASDFTDDRGACPYPGLFGCKGPAYRHNRKGPRTGSAGMIFCDGHARAVPFGSLTVANIFPNMPLLTKTPSVLTGGSSGHIAASPPKAQTPEYKITDLGTLGGNSNYHEWGGLNDKGEAVGGSQPSSGVFNPFLWHEGHMQDLIPSETGSLGYAMAINDKDQVVGFSRSEAFLWQQGRLVHLGTLPGYQKSWAYGISDSSIIVGSASGTDGSAKVPLSQAFLSHNGVMKGLGVPPNCSTSHADAVNDEGDVAGWGLDSHGHTHAFLYHNGKMVDIAKSFGLAMSQAVAINNAGHVVGDEGTSATDIHAFLWSDGHVQDLGYVSGYTFAKATGINDRDEVVGNAQIVGEPVAPFIWDRAHGMRSLGDLIPPGTGWYITKAFAINNKGQILCYGNHGDKIDQLCLLTPVAGH